MRNKKNERRELRLGQEGREIERSARKRSREWYGDEEDGTLTKSERESENKEDD